MRELWRVWSTLPRRENMPKGTLTSASLSSTCLGDRLAGGVDTYSSGRATLEPHCEQRAGKRHDSLPVGGRAQQRREASGLLGPSQLERHATRGLLESARDGAATAVHGAR